MFQAAVIAIIAVTHVVEVDCYQIQDRDLKLSCQALDKLHGGDAGMARSYASQIGDIDREKHMLAIIAAHRGDIGMARSYCNSISDRDKRNYCRSEIDR